MKERKILVVDDEKGIRDLLNKVFSKAGYVVRSAETAEEAFEILKEESIMIMFLDLKLHGMNGIEFCKRIRKENWIGFIFALTGYTDLFGLLECRVSGFDDFFRKPISMDFLLKAAQDAFEKIERWEIEDYDLM